MVLVRLHNFTTIDTQITSLLMVPVYKLGFDLGYSALIDINLLVILTLLVIRQIRSTMLISLLLLLLLILLWFLLIVIN